MRDMVAKPTLPTGYQDDLPTETVEFQIMMCQSISTAVAVAMSASNQATPPPPLAGVAGAVRTAVVGEAEVVEVEILSRLNSPATVTDVVKWVTMCGIVLRRTCHGTHLLLILRILLPRYI